MTYTARDHFTPNTHIALQRYGYNPYDFDVDLLALDLWNFARDPERNSPADVMNDFGALPNVLPQYRVGRRYRVRIPARDNIQPHTPQVPGGGDLVPAVDVGDPLAVLGTFSFTDWVDAINSVEAVARTLGVEPGSTNMAQVVADLIGGAEHPVRVAADLPKQLAGDYGMQAFHDALIGAQAAPRGVDSPHHDDYSMSGNDFAGVVDLASGRGKATAEEAPKATVADLFEGMMQAAADELSGGR